MCEPSHRCALQNIVIVPVRWTCYLRRHLWLEVLRWTTLDNLPGKRRSVIGKLKSMWAHRPDMYVNSHLPNLLGEVPSGNCPRGMHTARGWHTMTGRRVRARQFECLPGASSDDSNQSTSAPGWFESATSRRRKLWKKVLSLASLTIIKRPT